MARIITREEALNYEIFSSSLTGSWIRKVFFMFFYRRAERKYTRYLEGMKLLDALESLRNVPDTKRAEELLQISIDLEEINDDNPLGYNIKKLARNEKTLEALVMIKQIADTNRHMAESLLGEQLLLRVEKYLNK